LGKPVMACSSMR